MSKRKMTWAWAGLAALALLWAISPARAKEAPAQAAGSSVAARPELLKKGSAIFQADRARCRQAASREWAWPVCSSAS